MTDPILQVRGLSKHFGGLAAVDDVSLDVGVGELHAIIGPNGAGQTTLINVLSGDLSPSAGSVLFRGTEMAQLAPERRSRLGVGRSYQKVNIFPAFSVLENCRLAAQSREPRPLKWLRDAMSYESVLENARQAIYALGLGNSAAVVVAALCHG